MFVKDFSVLRYEKAQGFLLVAPILLDEFFHRFGPTRIFSRLRCTWGKAIRHHPYHGIIRCAIRGFGLGAHNRSPLFPARQRNRHRKRGRNQKRQKESEFKRHAQIYSLTCPAGSKFINGLCITPDCRPQNTENQFVPKASKYSSNLTLKL